MKNHRGSVCLRGCKVLQDISFSSPWQLTARYSTPSHGMAPFTYSTVVDTSIYVTVRNFGSKWKRCLYQYLWQTCLTVCHDHQAVMITKLSAHHLSHYLDSHCSAYKNPGSLRHLTAKTVLPNISVSRSIDEMACAWLISRLLLNVNTHLFC